MKAINLFFLVLFVISAALQYNDPDPYLWMGIYLYGAFLCYQGFRGRFNRKLHIFGLVIFGCYAIYLFFDKTGVLTWLLEHDAESIVQSMKATKPWIEETREFFGLLLLIAAVVFNMIFFSRTGQKAIYN